ncbi:hypothetical protein A2U01_0095256, partial [Trifolium medium]|nr:hypothetical protein [Trifolium medium]
MSSLGQMIRENQSSISGGNNYWSDFTYLPRGRVEKSNSIPASECFRGSEAVKPLK